METRYRHSHWEWEKKVLESLSTAEPLALLDRFSTLVRSSGKEDEKNAARYISDRLKHHGISHRVYEPTLYISLPVESSLQFKTDQGWETIRCSSPSFSFSTDPKWVEAEGAITEAAPRGVDDYVFDDTVVDPRTNVSGKIAFCEGIFSPAMVRNLEDLGAAGIVMVNPGQRIHESNCSTIWGTPTLDNMNRLPGVPVVSITQPDGERLRQMIRSGGVRLRMRTKMDVGWRPCPLVVAEILGADEPESFILIHGHQDSWYYGACDNATGNASLLELARVFHAGRDGLSRSVRVAWWPGHSHGRYAGSTWYADHFAIDIDAHCVAQINIDSPGSKWATAYDMVMMMDEAVAFCKQAIHDAVGELASAIRPQRAGDYSFNNMGVTSMYMLMSSIPKEVREAKGFYKVGGNGGNAVTWHTNQDVMEYVDPAILMKDLKIYVTTIARLANSLMLPYDFRKTLKTQRERLQFYQRAAGTRFDLNPAVAAIDALAKALDTFYAAAAKALKSASDTGVKELSRTNALLMDLGRTLIPIDYVNLGRFEHDPAVPIACLGRLEPALELPGLDSNPNLQNITATTLLRRRNQIVSAYRQILKRLEAFA